MVHDQLEVIAGMLGRQSAKVDTMLRDAAPDLLAFASFPPSHWKKSWSAHHEWQTTERRYLSETTMAQPATPPNPTQVATPELITA